METVLETVFETVFESNPEIKTCFIHPSTKDQKIIQKKRKKETKNNNTTQMDSSFP